LIVVSLNSNYVYFGTGMIFLGGSECRDLLEACPSGTRWWRCFI